MSQPIKTGHLRYYHKGLLSKSWKDYFFVLFNDSTLQWYEKQNSPKAQGSIRIRDIAQHLCVGPYTRCFPDRPQLPRPTDEPNLIALPRTLPGNKNQEIIWILCNDVTHLNDWMKAIVSTLPPPPQQNPQPPSAQPQGGAYRPPAPQQGANFRPSAPPPPSNPYGQQQQQQQQQQQNRPLYPQLPNNQQPSYNNTTVVVQPSPAYGGTGGSNVQNTSSTKKT
ncbi:unnamed protein product, partial [Adineta steineri]